MSCDSSSQLLREIEQQTEDDEPSRGGGSSSAHATEQTHWRDTRQHTTQQQPDSRHMTSQHSQPQQQTQQEEQTKNAVEAASPPLSPAAPAPALSRALSLLDAAPLSLSLPLAHSEVQLAHSRAAVSDSWLQLPPPANSAASSSASSCLSLAVSLCASPLPSLLIAHQLSAPTCSQRDDRSPLTLDPPHSQFPARDEHGDGAAAAHHSPIPTHPPELPLHSHDDAHDESQSPCRNQSPAPLSHQVAEPQASPEPAHSEHICTSVLSMSPIALSPSGSPLRWQQSPLDKPAALAPVNAPAPACKRALSLGSVAAVPSAVVNSAVSCLLAVPLASCPSTSAVLAVPVGVPSAAPRSILICPAVDAPKPRHSRSVRFDLPDTTSEGEQDEAIPAPRKPRAARIPVLPLRPPPPSIFSPDIELSMQLSAETAEHTGDADTAMELDAASSAPSVSASAAAPAASPCCAACTSSLFDLADDGDSAQSQLFDDAFFEPWMEADFGQHKREVEAHCNEAAAVPVASTLRPCELVHSVALAPAAAFAPPISADPGTASPSSSASSSIKIERQVPIAASPLVKTDSTEQSRWKLEPKAATAVHSTLASAFRKRALSPALSPDPSDEHAYDDAECGLFAKDELSDALHELPSDDDCIPFDPPQVVLVSQAAAAACPRQGQKLRPVVTGSPRGPASSTATVLPSKTTSSHYKRPRLHKQAAAVAAASGEPAPSLTAVAAAAGLTRTKHKNQPNKLAVRSVIASAAAAAAASSSSSRSATKVPSTAKPRVKPPPPHAAAAATAAVSSAVASSSSMQRSLSSFLQHTPAQTARPSHATTASSRRTYAQLPAESIALQLQPKITAAFRTEARGHTEKEDSMDCREAKDGPSEKQQPQSELQMESADAAAGTGLRAFCDLTEMRDETSQIFLYD